MRRVKDGGVGSSRLITGTMLAKLSVVIHVRGASLTAAGQAFCSYI